MDVWLADLKASLSGDDATGRCDNLKSFIVKVRISFPAFDFYRYDWLGSQSV